MITEASSVRSQLAEALRDQARWRERNAERHPDDDRDQRSANVLYVAARFVEHLPASDSRLQMLAALSEQGNLDMYLLPEHAYVEQFGFHRDSTASTDDFDRLLDCIVEATVSNAVDIEHGR